MVNTYKVVLCGKTGVGKTSLFRCMCGKPLECKKPGKTTKDHECKVTVEAEDGTVELELWDTLGLEAHAMLTRSHFLLSQAVLFVYSATDKDSLSQAADLLPFAKIHAQGACFILIRNKIDLEATVSKDDVMEAISTDAFALQFRTSAVTHEGIDEMLYSVASHLLKKATPMKPIGRLEGCSEGATAARYCRNGANDIISLQIEEPVRKKKCCHR